MILKQTFADLDSQKKKIIQENKIGEEEIIEKTLKNVKEQLEVSEREQHNIIASVEQKKEACINWLTEKRNFLRWIKNVWRNWQSIMSVKTNCIRM